MELRHLRYFTAVAQELHLGRAAKLLGIAQPALTKAIQALEAELGVMLVQHDHKPIRLTSAGQTFLVDARAILQHAERAKVNAERADRSETGRLAVGVALSALYLLPDVLRVFLAQHPEVELELLTMESARAIQALRAHRIAVAFVRSVGAGFVRIHASVREPLLVALPPDHPLAAEPELRLAALASESWLISRRGQPAFYPTFLSMCEDAGFTPRMSRNLTPGGGDAATLLAMVAAGAGISLFPPSMQYLGMSRVVFRPLVEVDNTSGIHVVTREDEQSSVAVAFLQAACQVVLDGVPRPA